MNNTIQGSQHPNQTLISTIDNLFETLSHASELATSSYNLLARIKPSTCNNQKLTNEASTSPEPIPSDLIERLHSIINGIEVKLEVISINMNTISEIIG